jgi:hypothetical protein
MDYLKRENLKGWTFRAVKVNKTSTIVLLNNDSSVRKDILDCCVRKHDKDNFLYLVMTAKTIRHECFKCKKDMPRKADV